mmetsp:Transcript_37477/g.57382  ORF Transcript_37477/g.57382 Transcript_37477/m.57382 type:complete len:108 (-) Transcript_37477:108-431(-)
MPPQSNIQNSAHQMIFSPAKNLNENLNRPPPVNKNHMRVNIRDRSLDNFHGDAEFNPKREEVKEETKTEPTARPGRIRPNRDQSFGGMREGFLNGGGGADVRRSNRF